MKNAETSKRLLLALDRKNMKAQDLADLSEVSKASISQYVNGTHAPSNLSAGKMAAVLGVSPVWLMGFDVPMLDKKDAVTRTLSTDEASLLDDYQKLNATGKKKAREDVRDLTEIPRYTEEESSSESMVS